jgi:hypothetical protein
MSGGILYHVIRWNLQFPFEAIYDELVASFANRSNLLK